MLYCYPNEVYPNYIGVIMARMNLIPPGKFVEWRRGSNQAEVVEGLVKEYLVGVVC